MLLLAFLSSACSTKDVQKLERIDLTQKTMTVPVSSAGLVGKLKTMLREEGWSLIVYQGPTVTEGTIGSETHTEQQGKFATRYRLVTTWSHTDGFGWYYDFSVVIIDNNTGAEALTISGNHGLGANIVKSLRDALLSQSKGP